MQTYIGRVGALAVALGVGVAVAAAWADPVAEPVLTSNWPPSRHRLRRRPSSRRNHLPPRSLPLPANAMMSALPGVGVIPNLAGPSGGDPISALIGVFIGKGDEPGENGGLLIGNGADGGRRRRQRRLGAYYLNRIKASNNDSERTRW